MESFFVSTLIVAIAEIGDKTQLLALVLAARFRQPKAIILGILLATLANHGAAAAMGLWITTLLSPESLRWLLGLSFLAMAAWALVPDEIEEGGAPAGRYGAFLATLVAFFLVEIGDKTQVATIGLAIHYEAIAAVVIGTTLGMMIANVPVVLLGNAAAGRIPLRAVRMVAAAAFLLLGLAVLLGLSG